MSQREERSRALKTMNEVISAYRHTCNHLLAEVNTVPSGSPDQQELMARFLAMQATLENLEQVHRFLTVKPTKTGGRR